MDAAAEGTGMVGRGDHDLVAGQGPKPPDAGVVRVDRLEALPGALTNLARLVARSWHLRPDTVGGVAVEHGRTVLTLSEVLARCHTVEGATAPALLGLPSELRADASTLATLRTAVRELCSTTDEDGRPAQQLREIRRRLRRENRRLAARLTDDDLHVVVASLRPALWVAPALRCAVTRQLSAAAWLRPARDGSWRQATTSSVPRVVDAALVARESGLRLIGSLATPPPAPLAGHAYRSRRHGRTARLLNQGAVTRRGVNSVYLA